MVDAGDRAFSLMCSSVNNLMRKMASKQKFNKGDKVEWSSGSGTATGEVQEYITEDKTVEGSKVSASKDDPRYLVKNDSTGNVSGHKAETLSKSSSNSSSSSSSSGSSSSNSSSSSGSSKSSDKFSKGDRVKWNTAQGETTGTVKKKLTSNTDIKGHTAKASEDDPQYLVESESTGEEAAHKPDSLEHA